MKKVIIDCDNTFGVEGCDLDDGLATIYALGTGRCELLGVTTTFGNNTLEVITPNTHSFMKEIEMETIPVYPGHTTDAKQNEAATFLAQTVSRYPGEVSILGIGSLTNLYHASLLDSDFFENVSQLTFMGGVTEPLIIMGNVLDELNFACNSAASYEVLTHGKTITIATGNACLGAFFSKERFDRMGQSDIPFLRWLCEKAQYWFKREKEAFGHDGIYKWDVYAAAALICPEFFDETTIDISPDQQSMETGMLIGKGSTRKITVPIVKDPKAFEEHVYESYARFGMQNK